MLVNDRFSRIQEKINHESAQAAQARLTRRLAPRLGRVIARAYLDGRPVRREHLLRAGRLANKRPSIQAAVLGLTVPRLGAAI